MSLEYNHHIVLGRCRLGRGLAQIVSVRNQSATPGTNDGSEYPIGVLERKE